MQYAKEKEKEKMRGRTPEITAMQAREPQRGKKRKKKRKKKGKKPRCVPTN